MLSMSVHVELVIVVSNARVQNFLQNEIRSMTQMEKAIEE